MKLLELLVKELSGAWPVEAHGAVQDGSGQIWFYKSGKPYYTGVIWGADPISIDFDWVNWDLRLEVSDDYATAIITRDQYEAAIASQQQVWNGEGLPPVGCECEFKAEDGSWGVGTILCVGGHRLFWLCHEDKMEYNAEINPPEFRPLRTEADRKREDFVSLLMGWMHHATRAEIEFIYDKIAAGKIPGVELSK